MSIGENIRKARDVKLLSQDELGKLVGATRNSIKQYENDDKVPSTKTLVKLSEVLDVSLDVLVGREPMDSVENIFTVEEFRVIRNVLEKLAQNDSVFNTYNHLFDKADKALRDMEKDKRLHKFDYAPVGRDVDSGNFFMMRRNRLHISRMDLAQALGVTTGVLCDWESGMRKPTRNHIPTLKQWLKLTDEEIETYIDSNYRKDNIVKQISEMSSQQISQLNNIVTGIVAHGETV